MTRFDPYYRTKPAIGNHVTSPVGIYKQISIQWPVDMFEEISNLAHSKKISFAEMVRTLVTWGLEDVRK